MKSGWRAGDGISFLMAFEKGGEEDPYTLFTENIGNAAETYGFLLGLSPEIFYIVHPMAIENETHHFIDIKLKRDGQEES